MMYEMRFAYRPPDVTTKNELSRANYNSNRISILQMARDQNACNFLSQWEQMGPQGATAESGKDFCFNDVSLDRVKKKESEKSK